MDGLLVDTERVVRDAMVASAEAMGATLPEAVFSRMIGLPRAESDEVAVAHFGPGFDHAAFTRAVDELVDVACEAGIAVKAGARELLDALQTKAIPTAIATSSSHAAVRRTLGPSGLVGRFDAIVAAGDYARGKPAPDPFLAAAARLGVAPADCLALEDSHNGVRAAHAAGMMTIMAPDLVAATDDIRARCHAVVETLHEVLELCFTDR
jgi:HAD superfamily hydrolase (TIGR01509 family)